MSTHLNLSVVIASDLRTGRSLYFTAESRWTHSITQAELLDENLAQERLLAARSDERDNLVVDPYLIGMRDSGVAVDIRERIRVKGPSIFEQKSNRSAA